MFDKIKVFSKQKRHDLVIPEQFYKLDFRVGEIIDAIATTIGNSGAYTLKINFGEDIGEKSATVLLLSSYNINELKGKQVIGITNITPKKVEGHVNEIFLVGVKRSDYEMVCIIPEFTLDAGMPLDLVE